MPPLHYPAEDEISVLHLLSVLLKHRYTVLGLSFGTAFLVAVLTILGPRSYTASGTFIPQGVERPGQAQRLAGQLGIDLGGGVAATESPQFYTELLRSREILSPILIDTFSMNQTTWRGDTVRVTGTLLELLEVDEERHPALRREAGLHWLRESAVSAHTRRETGVVEVSVTTPWPGVSARIGSRLLDLVNDFNLEKRQTQATAERSFIEARIDEAEFRLRSAEDELKRFLQNNRAFQNSPELVFEHDRLQRQVAMRQQLFTQLNQNLETARIQEVRNTPLITIVEPPEEPVRPDGRNLKLRIVLGLMLGGMLGVFWAYGREFALRSRENGDEDYREFHQVWEDTVDDVRRLVRLARGSRREASP
jgi:uncharacterized protein involved in exopolysaccharide biosynthesis